MLSQNTFIHIISLIADCITDLTVNVIPKTTSLERTENYNQTDII